ncbi:MAG: WD40 repeat domain-containing protein [Acetobacteraceae bacterium]|nr:WD40 repeat domain-containing protein [Acetobacteraceae bacterium]
MSGSSRLDRLLDERGTGQELGQYVVAAAFDRSAGHAAFALGDGTVRLVALSAGTEWTSVTAHDGVVLALAADATAGAFLTGGDDGGFRRIDSKGRVSEIASFGSKWVEHVASAAAEGEGRRAKGGYLACAVGRVVHLFDTDDGKLKALEHPSTVSGLAFDARGKRIATSHYNGATLWFAAAKEDSPRRLEWKGSHTGVVMHPDGEAVVTTMQENALHGWRLADGQHMRMSGYQTKVESLSFSRTGKWLATGGADVVVLWPFFGGGPMGKPPVELGGGAGELVTRVACHPQQDLCAAGFADGSVMVAEMVSDRMLPVTGPGRGSVSALAWSSDGATLAFGTDTGFAALIDFGKQAG